jgi:hypothetical protein
MRLKHNKKRNTAFVYEALVRELTKSIVKNNKNKQMKIVSIMKEHFAQGTELNKELDLYKSVYETKEIDRNIAEKIVVEAKQRYSDLDKKAVFQEQSALINKINRTLSKEIFTNFVPNYKNLATVYSIFQDALPVRDRVLLEESILEHMSASVESTEDLHQKGLLNKYISSFSDNGLEFKYYLNEELGSLKDRLQQTKDMTVICEDEGLKNKIDQVYSILDSYKEKEIDPVLIETMLKTQDLLEEINKDDTNS